MDKLIGLEPKEPLYFFEELCKIPHGSGNTKAISDYCVAFARERNLEVIQDEWNNIIITKEATPGYEMEDAMILQGHLDMVCEKTLESNFDFLKEGLHLETDGKWIWAKDTTLGGDDGIAIAMSLAVLDSKEISHPKIEAVFTVDEEIGLIGAAAIDLSSLTGKRMINIDSEDDGHILTSCAGGVILTGYLPMEYRQMGGMEYKIELKGLLGGHSGAEIHKERGNSNVLMGRILYVISEDVEVIDIYGGNAHNVIPSHTTAIVKVTDTQVLEKLKQVIAELQDEYSLSDGGMYLNITALEERESMVLDTDSKMALLNALMNLPNGIQSMSSAIPELVETSLNMGKLTIEDHKVVMKYNIRSSKESAKAYLKNRTVAMFEYMGGYAKISGDYPGWDYKVDSPLREAAVKVYTKCFGKDPRIAAIHAGLECGLFGSKIEGLDCISIGPNLLEIHSFNEKMEISSVERIWKLLLGILELKN